MSKPTKKPVVKMPDGSNYTMTNAEVLQFFDMVLAKNQSDWLNALADDKKYQQQARRLTKSQRQGIVNFIQAINQQPCDDEAIDTSIDEICGAIDEKPNKSRAHVAISKRKSH